jgi:gliding motility-associated-like protein
VKIQVFGNPNEFIPNGFSPNGDGTNDTWTFPGIELFPNNELIILNRWGSVVYQAAPYNNDWAGESGGNFSFGSDRLPDGTYFYILKLDKDSNNEGLTGTIEMRSKL